MRSDASPAVQGSTYNPHQQHRQQHLHTHTRDANVTLVLTELISGSILELRTSTIEQVSVSIGGNESIMIRLTFHWTPFHYGKVIVYEDHS